MRSKIKKIISVVILATLILTVAFSGSVRTENVDAAGKMKILKESQYKDMIQGGFSKGELSTILAYISGSRRNLTSKDLAENVKKGNYATLLMLYRDKLDPKYGKDVNYSIKKVNKFYSAITSFKFKKNKKYTDYLYTDKSRLHLNGGGEGFSGYIVTKSAKYNNKKLEIKYELHDSLAEENLGQKRSEGTYKATFKKLKNGKYRLNSLKVIKLN